MRPYLSMPSDDNSIDSLQHQFDLEDSSRSPVTKVVLNVLGAVSGVLPWPLDTVVGALKDRLAADANERIKTMVETLAAEVRKHSADIQAIKMSLSAEQAATREEAAKDLLLDAARKAANTRSIERVKRIGLILAHGIARPEPLNEDELEEMMRIATDLSDWDVWVLAAAVRQFAQERAQTPEAENAVAARAWLRMRSGVSGDELASIGAKLQSFGLTTRIEGITGDTNSYRVLERGKRFIEYTLRSAGEQVRPAP